MPGIADFYRQFGYEMAVVPEAGRRGHRAGVPSLREGSEGPYRVRPATEMDLPFMARTYRRGMQRSLVWNMPSPALWRYYLCRRTVGEQFQIIEDLGAARVGFLAHCPPGVMGALSTVLYELSSGASWLVVTPSVLRYLSTLGQEWLRFQPGTGHPAYGVMPDFLQSCGDPCAYDARHVRVPDLPRFLRLVAPVLETRLTGSAATGWRGELRLRFSHGGLLLGFRRGKLAAAEPWSPTQDNASACFRDLTFLSLLFGTRSLKELQEANPECYACDHEARVLLAILFPKQPSGVWAVL